MYVTFDDFGGMDADSIADLANWQLWAAGGDDSFGEGNEVDRSDLIQSAAWDASIGVATISLADGADETELFELRVGDVVDLAGNIATPPAEPLRFRGEDLGADTVVWKPVTGGDWNVAANWSTGVVPGADDRVVIGQSDIQITVTGNATVSRIDCHADLRIHSGTFTVTGNSEISGTLFAANGAALKADGGNAVLATLGDVTIDGASLYALSGGQLLLDGATQYVHQATADNQDRVIEANGAGSVISLAGRDAGGEWDAI